MTACSPTHLPLTPKKTPRPYHKPPYPLAPPPPPTPPQDPLNPPHMLFCLQIFAPLARLLGLYSIKEELEELSFKYSNPEAHCQMVKRMATLDKDQSHLIASVSPCACCDARCPVYDSRASFMTAEIRCMCLSVMSVCIHNWRWACVGVRAVLPEGIIARCSGSSAVVTSTGQVSLSCCLVLRESHFMGFPLASPQDPCASEGVSIQLKPLFCACKRVTVKYMSVVSCTTPPLCMSVPTARLVLLDRTWPPLADPLSTIIPAYYNPSVCSLLVSFSHHCSHKYQEYTVVWLVQACHSLEQVLAEDQYLSTRVQHVTIHSHQKAAYSVYRSACPIALILDLIAYLIQG